MMATQFHTDLLDREFGSAVLHVQTFFDWLGANGLTIDAGPLMPYVEYVQVENLLCAVGEAAISGLTLEDASAIVANDATLRASFVNRAASPKTKALMASVLERYDDKSQNIIPGANHVISSSAQKKWRELISRAVEQGELQLLDFASKLPIRGPAAAQAAEATPVEMPSNGERWRLNKPARFQGYAKPLYDVLKAAHAAGLPRPTPREVLEAFGKNQPAEIISVLSDGLNYYDANGNSKSADLNAIRKTIGRMTTD